MTIVEFIAAPEPAPKEYPPFCVVARTNVGTLWSGPLHDEEEMIAVFTLLKMEVAGHA